MQNTRYFNISSFNDYLTENVPGASLTKKPYRNSENIFLEDKFQERSFQLIERDFLANQSVTRGRYVNKKGVKGYWEEFRIRFKIPLHFKEKEAIPKGKYRIRVQVEDDKKPVVKPVVKTFVRKSIGVYSWWKEAELPPSLPLDKILNGSLEDYVVN